MDILILYGTSEGQTARISERMAEIIRKKDHRVSVHSCKNLPSNFSLDSFEAVIIGGSIHMGKYQAYLKKFIVTHRDWLNSIPSAFFTVCMAINSQHMSEKKEAKTFGDHFVANAGWQPHLIETFAGAVKYTKYNFVTRYIMKLISRREGGSTDTSHDHEYTDWDSVARFIDIFCSEIVVLENTQ